MKPKNRLDSLVYSTEKTIADNREKIPVGTLSEVEAAIVEAKKAVDSNDPAQISVQLDKLMRSSHKIAEALYQQQPAAGAEAADAAGAGAGAPGATPGATGKGPEDVIDAEYIDVDENK